MVTTVDVAIRPRVMGIVNVTPDSFSDGGCYLDPKQALDHGLRLVEQGAEILDLGGESTRPGSLIVPEDEQIRRLLPVVRGLRERLDAEVPISIDTTRRAVAEAMLDAGADWINDISAGEDDPGMLALAAERRAPIVLMHRSGPSATMQHAPSYGDVVSEVRDYLARRAEAALALGIAPGCILLDPGIGFGKTTTHNLALLKHLDVLVALGYPVLLGTSRKRFLGELCGGVPACELAAATAATTALGVTAGVRVVRVHDVPASRQAADVAWAVRQVG